MLSVILPSYNEEKMIAKATARMAEILQPEKIDYELLFIDDGSRDGTWAQINEAAEKDSHVVGVHFSRNFGKEAGIYAGLQAAKGDYVATMDADLQDPPALLPQMLDTLLTGEYDCAATRRTTRKGEPPLRSWFARKFYQIINKMSDTEIVDGARDFRLMSRKMTDAVLSMAEYNRFSKGIFSWVGFKTKWFDYENIERVAGTTKWNFWGLFKYSIEGIVGFSTTPLLIAAPTTAGTGSETTLAAVITDSAAHHKYPINDFALIPDYAVLDPELTRGLPPMLTATTGMDALTHAIEAYIGRSTTKLTRAMSEEAATRIVRSLYTAYENGGDMQARADMLRAAYCAGVSFTRSYVGYVHGVAHSLGGQYGVPHGLANAVILPYFLDAYGAACHQKLGRLARVAHVAPQSASDREAAEAFIRWIREMNARMGIPEKIPQIRTADIPEMARHAARESNPLYPVPVLMDERQLAQMYVQLMPAKKEENA